MDSKRYRLFFVLVAVVAHATMVRGQAASTTYRLTLDQALDLARSRSPSVRVAQARIDEARGRIVEASVRLRENPSLEVGGGPRTGSESRTTDFEIVLSQTFELGGKRGARIDSATAELDAATATAGERLREALRDVAFAFLRTRHVEQRLRIAKEVEALSVELSRVATTRYGLGDVGILDVQLAEVATARAKSEARRLQAVLDRSLGDLRIVLGLEGDAALTLSGELLERRRFDLGTLLSRSSDRADLQVIEATLRSAEAEARLAKAHSWPDLGLSIGYAREERADIVAGGVTITLPVFERGQGLHAIARARSTLHRLELEVTRNLIDTEVRTALIAYHGLVEAVGYFEADGLPQIESTDELTRISYEAGAIPLGEVLTARRELIGARVAYADLLLDAALAGVEVEAAAGLLR